MAKSTRRETVLNAKVVALLQEQVKMEAHASATYLAMSSWCEVNGFPKSAAFFLEHAEEERGHMLKIFHFLNDNGARAFSPEVKDIPQEFKGLRDVYEKTFDHEIAVTDSINAIVKLARKEEDYASEHFLQWFVEEQLEEERLVRDILSWFDFVNEKESKFALRLIDERIPVGA